VNEVSENIRKFIVVLSLGACPETTKRFVAQETHQSSQQTGENSNVKNPTEENSSITYLDMNRRDLKTTRRMEK
jgi:hypothetical protein